MLAKACVVLGCFVLALSTMTSPGSAVAGPNLVGGHASGLEARTAHGSIDRVPEVVLPDDGGRVDDATTAITVPEVASVAASSVVTTGSATARGAEVVSTATVEDVNLLNGLITARRVVAASRSRSDGRTATSSADGSTFVGLVIDGVALGDVKLAANTRIDIPGVGTLMLNFHVPHGTGGRSSGLTVTMIHLMLDGPGGGEITVASAHSEVTTGTERVAASGPGRPRRPQ